MNHRLLACTIPGTPQQQGSKRSLGPGRPMIEANAKLGPWRADAIVFLRAAALAQWGHAGESPIDHPVTVEAWFAYARPKGHCGTGRNAGKVKAGSPYYKASAPDLDKLQRALGDALTQAGIVRDDALIVRWEASKVYADAPSVQLIIRRADS